MTSSVGIDPSVLLAATPHGASRNLDGRSAIEIAREFEAMLVAQMMSAMRKTVGESDLLPASPHRKVFDGAFDQQLARTLVEEGGLGLAESLAAQLRRNAEFAEAPVGDVRRVVDGRISSGYGTRTDPLTGKQHFHAGIDVAAPAGSEIRSARDGVVVYAGERGAAGKMIEVRHADGSVTAYAHAESLLRKRGDTVRAGEAIATVGSTGRSTGPHLHFSVRQGGRTVEPTAWLIAEPSARSRRA